MTIMKSEVHSVSFFLILILPRKEKQYENHLYLILDYKKNYDKRKNLNMSDDTHTARILR